MFTLGRGIDFSYKTNQIIAVSAILVAATGWILTGNVLSGMYTGMGVFLTWALSRELDPTHDHSALLAAAVSLLNLLYYDTVQILVIVWLLLLMRIVNGITGKKRTTFDIVSVFGLTLYLSLNSENSIYLLIFLLAMVFNLKTGEKTRELLIASGISFGLFLVESIFMNYLSFNSINELNTVTGGVVGTVGLSFILFWFLSKDESKDDMGNRVNRFERLASQLLYSIAVLLLFLFGGVSVNNLVIYLSVIVGVTIYFIGFKILNRNRVN
ncbi:hypothetical protein [Lacticigenium naphthae]|uniref:hypothetical protein n=1 Tax=Lacticigenium naphthae TaxID=515351 RepID=UPI0004233C0D|nr:hypothetical protein [Lacticigenium naphthae]